jgi:uncharacterized Fe-S center protein
MASQVFFADLRANLKRTFNQKLVALMKKVELRKRQKKGGLCAVKLHFGEKGNTAFIRPVHVRLFVDEIKAAGAKPFLTDANTLYVGSRSDSVSHLETAVQNGFAYSVVGAPVIIADGLKGQQGAAIAVNLPECDQAYIASDIAGADSLVSLAHFKGHELSGFGGTIKNLGMGCGSRQGKLFMHSNVSPTVNVALCIACGQCVKRCPAGAIKLVRRAGNEPDAKGTERPGFKALKDDKKCIGCGDCILACSQGAMQVQWDTQIPDFQRRMAAYTKGVLAGKEGRTVFFNFLTQVSPACDCYPMQDAPIVADLGVMASLDPVALDQASVDLINQAPGSAASCLKSAHAPGTDKFRDLYPNVDWTIQLKYAEQIGLGSRQYQLVKV